MTDAPTTTGRRTWRLIGPLALSWVVCGALLWALVGLTPEPPAFLIGWGRAVTVTKPGMTIAGEIWTEGLALSLNAPDWPAGPRQFSGRSLPLP